MPRLGAAPEAGWVYPTLAQAHGILMDEDSGFGAIPEEKTSGLGAWVGDVLWTALSVRANTQRTNTKG
eukprot:595337-Heterocapsa_arctica.AAC.1